MSNLIINGGFELSTSTFCKAGWCSLSNSAAISPWTLTSSNKNFEVDSTPWPSYEGSWSMDLNGNSAYTIGQSVTTTPGLIYRLSFQLRANLCGQSPIYSGFVNTDGQNLGTFSYNTTLSGSSWVLTTFNITAVATTTLVEIGSSTVGGCGPVIDDVRMVLVGDSNLVVNGGFEDSAALVCPAAQAGDKCQLNNQSAISPWFITSAYSKFDLKKGAAWPVYEGLYSLDLNSDSAFTVAQFVPTTTGSSYNLTFYARLNQGCSGPNIISGFVRANNQIVGTFTLDRQTLTSQGPVTSWRLFSFFVTTNTPSTLLEIGSTTATECGIVIDAVRMISLGNINYIKNGGFEANAAAHCNAATCTLNNQAAIAPWTVTSSYTFFELDSLAWTNAEGSWSMDLNSDRPYTIGQSVATLPGAMYRLSFQLNYNQHSCRGMNASYNGFVRVNGNDVGPIEYNSVVSQGAWVLTSYMFAVNTVSTLIEIGSSSSGICGPVIDDVKMHLV